MAREGWKKIISFYMVRAGLNLEVVRRGDGSERKNGSDEGNRGTKKKYRTNY